MSARGREVEQQQVARDLAASARLVRQADEEARRASIDRSARICLRLLVVLAAVSVLLACFGMLG